MSVQTIRCILFPVLFFGLIILCPAQDRPAAFSRGSNFVGPLLTYNKRAAFIDFETIRTSVAVSRPDLLTLGLGGGIRLPLLHWLRAQAGISIDAGSSADDTLYTAHVSVDKFFFYHASIEAALHLALAPPAGRLVPFLAAGAGGNGVWVNEKTYFLDQQYQEVIYLDRKYVSDVSWSVSAFAGLGLDINLGTGVAISLVSTFRFLYPVSYGIQEDLPLYAMKCTETLYGNVTWVGITFAMK
jgi:hypothetical protein